MKPGRFLYVRPVNVDEVVGLLADLGEDATLHGSRRVKRFDKESR
jgi:hypothetical protein